MHAPHMVVSTSLVAIVNTYFSLSLSSVHCFSPTSGVPRKLIFGTDMRKHASLRAVVVEIAEIADCHYPYLPRGGGGGADSATP